MRNGRGQWRSGYSGNPRGRPAVPARVTDMRTALLEAVTPEDVAAVAKGLVAAAKGGDTTAARVLLAYSVGRAVGDFDPAEHGEPVSPELARRIATLESRPPAEQVRALREMADRIEADMAAGKDVDNVDDLSLAEQEELFTAALENVRARRASGTGAAEH